MPFIFAEAGFPWNPHTAVHFVIVMVDFAPRTPKLAVFLENSNIGQFHQHQLVLLMVMVTKTSFSQHLLELQFSRLRYRGGEA